MLERRCFEDGWRHFHRSPSQEGDKEDMRPEYGYDEESGHLLPILKSFSLDPETDQIVPRRLVRADTETLDSEWFQDGEVSIGE